MAVKLPIVFFCYLKKIYLKYSIFQNYIVLLYQLKLEIFMDSLGDYIYLIILAVVGISSLLKKKKVKPDATAIPSIPEQDWEDEMRERNFEEDIEIEEIKPSRENQVIPMSGASYNLPDEGTSSLRFNKKVSNTRTSKKPKKDESETAKPGKAPQQIQLTNLQEAKNAFIYSEIFNKKY